MSTRRLKGSTWQLEFPSVEEAHLFSFCCRMLSWHATGGLLAGKKISVYIATWNMGALRRVLRSHPCSAAHACAHAGNAPPPTHLDELLRPGTHDIYAIGLQESDYTPRPPYTSGEDDVFGTLKV